MAREHRERRREERDSEFTDKLVHINRVAKVVKGGRVSASRRWWSSGTPRAVSDLGMARRAKCQRLFGRRRKPPSAG